MRRAWIVGAWLLAGPAAADEVDRLRAEVARLQREVSAREAAQRRREDRLEELVREVRGSREGDGPRGAPAALPFLAAPPVGSDTLAVARTVVFAPQVRVDASRPHDLVSIRVRRLEGRGSRPVGSVDLGRDQFQVDVPLDESGALFVLDWSTGEGQSFTLVLTDGASGQAVATVPVKPLQAQGRFVFVGYRLD